MTRATAWRYAVLTTLLPGLVATTVMTPPPRHADADPHDQDKRHMPLAVEVAMKRVPAVNETVNLTIIVSSTEPATDVRVEHQGACSPSFPLRDGRCGSTPRRSSVNRAPLRASPSDARSSPLYVRHRGSHPVPGITEHRATDVSQLSSLFHHLTSDYSMSPLQDDRPEASESRSKLPCQPAL